MNSARDSLTLEKIGGRLIYDRAVGKFYWTCGRRKGFEAGGFNAYGYRVIVIDAVAFQVHRLVWFYEHGAMPKNQIDHINGNRSDNRIENLREATPAQNMQNRRTARKGSPSKLIGVVKPARGRCFATISFNGKRVYLGKFDTPEEAHEAYLKAKRELHEFCTI